MATEYGIATLAAAIMAALSWWMATHGGDAE